MTTPIQFQAGTHTGYQLDAAGAPTATKPYTMPRESKAPADRRGKPATTGGSYWHIVEGVFDDYWVPESVAVYEAFTPARDVTFAAGQHTGYRFDPTGVVTNTLARSLSAASSARADGRAEVGGKPHWLVANGVFAGSAPESALVCEALRPPARPASWRATTPATPSTRTASRRPRGRASCRPTRARQAAGRAEINGTTYWLIEGGVWDGL